MSGDHDHPAAGGPDDGAGPDWFRVLDVVVWFAVGLIVVIGAEWLIGYLVREKIARGADRYLAKVTAAPEDPGA